MYPEQSNWRSGAPDSAWIIIGRDLAREPLNTDNPNRANRDEGVLSSQWDVILKQFQRKARTLLPATWSFDLANASCAGGTQRTTSDIVATGEWNAVTAEALCALLCRSVGPELAAAAARSISQSKDSLNEDTVHAIVAFAFFITHVGTLENPSIGDGELASYRGLRLPSGALLPSKSIPVRSAPADADYYAMFDPKTDPLPTAPSRAAANGHTLRLLLGFAIAGGFGYALWAATQDSPRARRSR